MTYSMFKIMILNFPIFPNKEFPLQALNAFEQIHDLNYRSPCAYKIVNNTVIVCFLFRQRKLYKYVTYRQ